MCNSIEIHFFRDDICVLSATGTAAVINLNYNAAPITDINLETAAHQKSSYTNSQQPMHTAAELMTTSLDRIRFERDAKAVKVGDQKVTNILHFNNV